MLLLTIVVGLPDPLESPPACPAGRETRLEIQAIERPKFLRHDQSIGRDKLILRSSSGPDQRELFSAVFDDGRWICLAFNSDAGRYVVGGIGAVGAWLPLRSVSYLSERTRKLEVSRFTRKKYLALASVTGPDGHYVAFVGGVDGVDGVYVLDTTRDTIRRLGPAPSPPPVENFDSDEPFDWGTGWADGYRAIEASVLRFEAPNVVVATYGRDTHKARAKKRTVRRFKL